MALNYDSVKSFLEKNLIFFQVATPILLMLITVMNISMSLSLTKRSIQDSRIRTLPQFFAEADLVDTDANKEADRLELNVYLLDGKASKIKVETLVLLDAEVYDKTNVGTKYSFTYPLLDFYLHKHAREEAETKIIKKFTGNHNWTYFSHLSDTILNEGLKEDFGIFLSLRQYLRIEYEDLYHSPHVAYFHSTSSQGYEFEEISSKEGKEIFMFQVDSKLEKDVVKRKFIDQFTTKALLNQILEDIKNG